MADQRHGLGRGLSALLGDDDGTSADHEHSRAYKMLPIEYLSPGRYQPRRHMTDERIEDLAQSIRQNGILQPIVVRRLKGKADAYEIVAGERRWRAAQRAKLHSVPVLIKDLSDVQALEIALVENLQREGLSPLEEADGFSRLMTEFKHTAEQLATALGKSRSHVANTLRLLNLPDTVKAMLDDGRLSAGHGRALLTATDPVALAREVIRLGLNVRQTERLAAAAKSTPGGAAKGHAPKDADTLRLEKDLGQALGLKVELRHGDKGGQLTLRYTTLEQLDDLVRRLSGR